MQRMKHMKLDPELIAMNTVSEVLKYLNHRQRIRVIDWAKARFNLIEEIPVEVVEAAEIPVTVETPAAQAAAPAAPITPAMPTEPKPEPTASVVEPEETKPTTVKTKQAVGKIFTEFETIDDLFLRVNAKKVSHRILLVAAYLQEKGNLHEVSSIDINSQLKRLGYGVSNITTLINGLLKKTPPQIIVTKKEGATKQSRRKFKVTEKGFKDAQTYITPTDKM